MHNLRFLLLSVPSARLARHAADDVDIDDIVDEDAFAFVVALKEDLLPLCASLSLPTPSVKGILPSFTPVSKPHLLG